MPPFLSPSRNYLTPERPCWLDSLIALPSLDLKPLPEGRVECRIMDAQGAWAFFHTTEKGLPWLIRRWMDDPELCCLELFHGRLPKGKTWTVQESELSAEDLGL